MLYRLVIGTLKKIIVNNWKKRTKKTSRPQLVPSIEDNDDGKDDHNSKHSLNDSQAAKTDPVILAESCVRVCVRSLHF